MTSSHELLLRLLLARGRLWVAMALVALGTAVWAVLVPRSYTVEVAFIAQQKRNNAGLSGLAAQVGLTLGGSEPGQSPSFYSDLVTGRNIGLQVVSAQYTWSGGAGTLVDFFGVSGAAPSVREERALKRLHGVVSATPQQKTGIIRVRITMRDSSLSRQVAEEVVRRVDLFNRKVRRSQASAELEFASRRLEEAGNELRTAEDRLEAFLKANRAYQNSPSLVFDYDRLSRELLLRQQTYSTLTQAVEQSRLDEVRDTPVLTVLEPPLVPALPDSRALLARLIVLEVLATLTWAAFVLAPHALGFARPLDEPDIRAALYAEARALLRSLRIARE